MKKFFTTFMFVSMFAVMMTFAATTASAQTRHWDAQNHRWVYYKRPNFYRRHRKAVNIGGGAVAGAIVGGLIGGKRGVVIGGAAGAGGGAIFHHYQGKRHRRHYYRNN